MRTSAKQNSNTKIQKIVKQLLASENVCDQRKGRDLQQLLQLSQGSWRSRFEVLGARTTTDRSLVILCRLQVVGLIWSGDKPVSNNTFICALGIPNNYPLSKPWVKFLGQIPWCCHVVHRDFVPDSKGLPANLQEYLRQGAGNCCYTRTSQWTPSVTLAIVIWQVSRLLTFSKVWGEAGSLNLAARDYALRTAKEGKIRLPLGEPLAYPHDKYPFDGEEVFLDETAQDSETEEDIEWVIQPEESIENGK